MAEPFYNEWLKLSSEDKLAVFQETANKKGLLAAVIEKDWWVCITLRIIKGMKISQHLVFKGGTSLSKGWNLIDRFSEDIDLILDRGFLGFHGTISNKKVNELRRANKKYVTTTFIKDLDSAIKGFGIDNINMTIAEKSISLGDPIQIDIYYPSLTEDIPYIQPRVQIEIGSRSLREPCTDRDIVSFVGTEFEGRDFADPKFPISCVNPERTFLEKVFIIHEEFQKPNDKIRIDRLSRHLYDLSRLMNTGFADIALSDLTLYDKLVEHRKLYYKVSGIDYNKHQPKDINLIPSEQIYKEWENDYNSMKEDIIFSEPPSLSDLMSKIKSLQARVNKLNN